ncbi:hypothetical protein ABW20_dc0107628 [Dactylellina cionopaga]|nr:hypothetical protein ABW20_dc0107628 [Dactylellina cionopaga]
MPFDTNGAVTQFIEGLPIVGYFVTLKDVITGDIEPAKRAFARATYASMVFAAATVVTLGGATFVGCAVATSVGTLVGIKTEQHIADEFIEDTSIRENIPPTTFKRFFKEAFINVAGGAVMEGLQGVISSVAKRGAAALGVEEVTEKINAQLEKAGLDTVTSELGTA